MADLDHNPWVFTSTDVNTTVPVTRDLLRPAGVRWTGASDAAHAVKFKDVNGNVVLEMTSTASDYTEETQILPPPGADWNGLVIAQLDSGTVYLMLQ